MIKSLLHNEYNLRIAKQTELSKNNTLISTDKWEQENPNINIESLISSISEFLQPSNSTQIKNPLEFFAISDTVRQMLLMRMLPVQYPEYLKNRLKYLIPQKPQILQLRNLNNIYEIDIWVTLSQKNELQKPHLVVAQPFDEIWTFSKNTGDAITKSGLCPSCGGNNSNMQGICSYCGAVVFSGENWTLYNIQQRTFKSNFSGDEKANSEQPYILNLTQNQ